MHVGCYGFLEFCKYVIENHEDLYYIPVLHYNQSSLEAHFSLMCWCRHTYENTVNILDNEISMSKLKNNPMYDPYVERYFKAQSLTGDKIAERKLQVESCEFILGE